jgi:VanZ family protein
MLPLRYPWLWKLAGWMLIAGVVVGSLMPGHAIPRMVASDKVLHAGMYFLLMIWFAGLYPRSRHWWIALGLMGLGLTLDLLQGMTSTRSFDPADIAANVAGIVVAFVLSYRLLEGWCLRMEQWLAPS